MKKIILSIALSLITLVSYGQLGLNGLTIKSAGVFDIIEETCIGTEDWIFFTMADDPAYLGEPEESSYDLLVTECLYDKKRNILYYLGCYGYSGTRICKNLPYCPATQGSFNHAIYYDFNTPIKTEKDRKKHLDFLNLIITVKKTARSAAFFTKKLY